MYEDIFPTPPPFVDPDGKIWVCTPSNATGYVQLWRKGFCLFQRSISEGSFEPTPEQLANARTPETVMREYLNMPPTEPQNVQKRVKDKTGLIAGATASTVMSVVVTLVGTTACAETVGIACPLAYRAISGTWALTAAGLGLLAKDPPDPNFTVIAQPITISLPQQPFALETGWSQQEVDAVNVLLDNLQQSLALQKAIFISLNRADGALLARDAYWEGKQVEAAQGYFAQLRQLVDEQPKLLNDLVIAIRDRNIEITLDEASILEYQSGLIISGFSQQELDILLDLDADAVYINEARLAIALNNSSTTVALGESKFPDVLVDPTIISQLESASVSLGNGLEPVVSKSFLPLVTR
jgi:hypothetical protein